MSKTKYLQRKAFNDKYIANHARFPLGAAVRIFRLPTKDIINKNKQDNWSLRTKEQRNYHFGKWAEDIKNKTMYYVVNLSWDGVTISKYTPKADARPDEYNITIPSYCLKVIHKPEHIDIGYRSASYRHPGVLTVGCHLISLEHAEKIVRFGKKQQKFYQQLTSPSNETKNAKRISRKKKKTPTKVKQLFKKGFKLRDSPYEP